uniref:BPTI/Kunitz inhibitor domain-containing protein n=1 Tax=Heterorhabditis bacteriophora TaxID=37862 RepID=A0A1I7WPW6_HETBA
MYYFQQPNLQQRTVYYPVRTNCQNKCAIQNRYRWNYRPIGECNKCCEDTVSEFLIERIIVSWKPLDQDLDICNLYQYKYIIQIWVIIESIILFYFYSIIEDLAAVFMLLFVNRLGLSRPLVQNVLRPVVPSPIPYPHITRLPFTFTTRNATTLTSTLPTPPPETSEPTTEHTVGETTTELPTPPPESPQPPTTRYLRPEKKPVVTKTSEFTDNFYAFFTCFILLKFECIKMYFKEFLNPCPAGRTLTNEFAIPISCNYLNKPNGGCPEEYWCHIGASFSTTACCRKSETIDNRCEQRRDTGEGDELIARWHFDKQAGQCKRSTIVDNTNPCKFNQPARDKNGSRIICGPNNDSMCPKNFYCHIGESPEYTACCESSGFLFFFSNFHFISIICKMQFNHQNIFPHSSVSTGINGNPKVPNPVNTSREGELLSLS